MAVKKTAGGAKKASAPKKAGGPKSAAKTETPKKSTTSVKKAAPKKAAPKKAAAPVKLSTSQTDLLKKIHGHTDPVGYRPEKKAEQRSLDALHERKLIKRGPKHKESGTYHYQISNIGKKHVDSTGGSTGTGTGSPAPSGGA